MANIKREEIAVSGMTCTHCEKRIREALSSVDGIAKAEVSYADARAVVDHDCEKIDLNGIYKIITDLGYEPCAKPSSGAAENAVVCVLIAGLYLLLDASGVLNLLTPDIYGGSSLGLAALFAVGLATSLHCIAMCGGINLSQSLPAAERAGTFRRPLMYNGGRVISYTLTGALLGAVGMALGTSADASLSETLQGAVKLAAGVCMAVMGINMLNIFPPLRRFTGRLKRLFNLSGCASLKLTRGRGAFIVGLLNGLMPCGALQSMQTLALATASPLSGAASMFAFSLGTVPLMMGFGTLVSALGNRFRMRAVKFGGALVVVMGFAMLSQGCALSGIAGRGTFRLAAVALCCLLALRCISSGGRRVRRAAAVLAVFAVFAVLHCGVFMADEQGAQAADKAVVKNGVQTLKSTMSEWGTYPNIEVKAGIPVKWILNAPKGTLNGCNYIILMNDFGVQTALSYGDNVIEFTPEKPGTYQYTCWMGMLAGNVTVR